MKLNKVGIGFGVLFCMPLLFLSLIDFNTDTAADALPLFLGFPLALWMGAPWRFREHPDPPRGRLVACCVIGMLIGFVANVSILFAAAWTALLWLMTRAYIEHDEERNLSRLLLIPFLSFPWLILDGQALGWFFRLSGAWASEAMLSGAGFEIVREGTLLYVNDICVSVGASCAGLNTLQTMLLGGAVLAYSMLQSNTRFWWHLPIIVAAAWTANTIRVALTGLVAVQFGPGYASGAFHEWEGWVVLLIMFVMSASAFAIMKSDEERESAPMAEVG